MLDISRRAARGPSPDSPPPLPANAALFLDFDGSLVEIAPRPEQVTVEPRLPALLEALAAQNDGALAIVSGRRLADIDAWLAPLRLRGAGAHGTELRDRIDVPPRTLRFTAATNLVRELRQRFRKDPRILVEDKGAVVALHFRQAPERAQECSDAMRALVARHPEFDAIAGSMVVEARPRGWNKGRAVWELSHLPPFRKRTPVFVGDDVSDEDAFAVVAELRGFGIKVGKGPTRARYRVEGVGAVHDWLRRSLARDGASERRMQA